MWANGEKERNKFENTILDIINKPSSELADDLSRHLHSHNSLIEQHLQALEQALCPVLSLQFLSWCMDKQNDNLAFFQTLFGGEFGLSSSQLSSFYEFRQNLIQNNRSSTPCTPVSPTTPTTPSSSTSFSSSSSSSPSSSSRTDVSQFANNIRRQVKETEDAFDMMKRLFLPQQLAKFFKWVNTYGHVCLMIHK